MCLWRSEDHLQVLVLSFRILSVEHRWPDAAGQVLSSAKPAPQPIYKFFLFLFLRVQVFCLHVCLGTTYVQLSINFLRSYLSNIRGVLLISMPQSLQKSSSLSYGTTLLLCLHQEPFTASRDSNYYKITFGCYT